MSAWKSSRTRLVHVSVRPISARVLMLSASGRSRPPERIVRRERPAAVARRTVEAAEQVHAAEAELVAAARERDHVVVVGVERAQPRRVDRLEAVAATRPATPGRHAPVREATHVEGESAGEALHGAEPPGEAQRAGGILLAQQRARVRILDERERRRELGAWTQPRQDRGGDAERGGERTLTLEPHLAPQQSQLLGVDRTPAIRAVHERQSAREAADRAGAGQVVVVAQVEHLARIHARRQPGRGAELHARPCSATRGSPRAPLRPESPSASAGLRNDVVRAA